MASTRKLISRKKSPSQESVPATSSRPEPWGDGQYRALFEKFPQPAWVLDRATLRFLAVNAAAIALYGYSREQFLAMTIASLHVPHDVAEARQRLALNAPSNGSAGWRFRTRSGVSIRAEVMWQPVGFDRVPALLMVAEPAPQSLRRLLLETEESRKNLEALSWRLVSVLERERAEIAREMHDEMGQLLTGLKLLIAAEPGDPAPGNGAVSRDTRPKVNAIVSELVARVRDLSMNLRPPMLDSVGLVPTLEWYFDRYTARTGVRVSFHHEIALARFSSVIEITAFRIIQEALTNAARHAGVDRITVEVRADPEELRLLIEDRGKGFDTQEALARRSAGIIGMLERANLVGGHLTLESAMESGTRIAVELPSSSSEEYGQDGRP
jgi:PAS domain S-box-containing protein